MKTILALTDFSDHATNAVRYAVALAPHLNARLVLVHAIALEIIEVPGNPFVRLPDVRLENYYTDILQHQAAQYQLQNKDLEIQTQCVHGPIGAVLNNLIQENQADLVVMGTRGASTFLKKLWGTQSAGLMKEACCPVLVIPANSRYRPIQNIAYASDFETRQISFLKQLLPFAEPLNAGLYIFNVKNDDQLDLVADTQLLHEIDRTFPRNNFSYSQLQDQDVVTGIQQFVHDNNIDLLAVCVHKPDILEKIFHTSVSRELAFQSNIPLLTLPDKPYHHRKAETTTSTNQER
ncbi:universal stress protein [Adhaeribacter aerolatus]|nr:universal stress protein [Adhaeribacter aerolatus]